mmetsp:Transcript_15775/g.23220  ORF Transcript_15775/g.23220 Transcript_15775/m.23220 type:complete len:475 (+) Transcript_15775:118-1542(+)
MSDAAERKRKRLDAWRKRQQQLQPPKVPVQLNFTKQKKKKIVRVPTKVIPINPFGDDGSDNDFDTADGDKSSPKPLWNVKSMDEDDDEESPRRERKKTRRWDVGVGDALDSFMEKLSEGAMGKVVSQKDEVSINVDVDGSMVRPEKKQQVVISGQAVTQEQLDLLKHKKGDSHYTSSDWESEAVSEQDTEDEEEEQARRNFLEALKASPGPLLQNSAIEEESPRQKLATAAQVKTEKERREERLKELETEAASARHAAEVASAPEFGRLYNDSEDFVPEEAERNLGAAMAEPDALEVLAELNKKKELKSVDHSKIDYIKFRKNLYIVPRALAKLTHDEIINRRAKLKIRIRGQGSPAPVSSFTECGVSERICNLLKTQNILSPYPVQVQSIPCIMAGRDVIGIAKTGSGKTLAYLLPLLRHIGDQPPLGPQESGPIGLILAPARELATQIHSVCRVFCKHLGLNDSFFCGSSLI